MKLLDRIILNRTLAIISAFFLGLLKIFSSGTKDTDIVPKPPTDKPVRFPRIRKIIDGK
jgi:hypothetical protein